MIKQASVDYVDYYPFIVYFHLLLTQFVRKPSGGSVYKMTSSSSFPCLKAEAQYIIYSCHYSLACNEQTSLAAVELRCVVTPGRILTFDLT